tara:strand:+ start:11 stop:676 length:666 start_codon:yes stop_codon:yes gene_type:complete
MPNCLQCIDNTISSSKIEFSRSDFDLPEDAFVFCNFGRNEKITSKEFDAWMGLLLKVNKSVLWLLESNSISKTNLIREAHKRGVDKSRIIFSKKIDLQLHMNRQKCANLYLDTFNYNSGFMTFIALNSKLPVLTLSGKSFSARISTSILHSLNLNELITDSIESYKKIAYKMSIDNQFYSDIVNRLSQAKQSSDYFNTELFTKNLEDKYKELVQNKNNYID